MFSRRCWAAALCYFYIAAPFFVLSDDKASTRIVDGIPVEEGEFDFFGIPNPFFCGGSLIHPQVFLTAAHCQCGYIEATEIHLGSIERLNTETALDIIPLTNERVVHPGYRSSTLENDMLLLKLARPAIPAVEPAVWATTQPSAGEDVTAIGFGATSQGGSGSNELLKVTVPVIGYSTCSSRDYYGDAIDQDSMVCAGEEGRDSCQGDSGGPLLNEQREIVGLTSWGDGCARRNKPGVYTNVANYDLFIRQSICALADDRPDYCNSLNFDNIRVDTGGECPDDEEEGICSSGFLSCIFDLIRLVATCACG